MKKKLLLGITGSYLFAVLSVSNAATVAIDISGTINESYGIVGINVGNEFSASASYDDSQIPTPPIIDFGHGSSYSFGEAASYNINYIAGDVSYDFLLSSVLVTNDYYVSGLLLDSPPIALQDYPQGTYDALTLYGRASDTVMDGIFATSGTGIMISFIGNQNLLTDETLPSSLESWFDNPDVIAISSKITVLDNLFTTAEVSGNVSLVPVPAAIWLFGSGLVGLIGVARRKKAA